MGLTQDLHALYLIDQQVRGLSAGLNAAAAHLRNQTSRLDDLRQQLAELRDQLRHAKAAAGNLESEAGGVAQRIEKLREQMNSAKTNREYSTFLVEINTLKIEREKLEEQALEHLTRADKLAEDAEALGARVAEQEKLEAHAKERLEERRAEIGDRLEQVKAKRASAARGVPGDALNTFEKLADALDGEALAEVTREDPRSDYTCGGCYMALPMERVNLLATTDNLIRCPSCTRILFLASNMREAMTGK